MATGDADPVLVDINVLVYANVACTSLYAEALTTIRAYHRQEAAAALALACLSEEVSP
jgi:hypothetical protein